MRLLERGSTLLAAVVVAFVLGFGLHWLLAPAGSPSPATQPAAAGAEAPPETRWTCSMHPQVDLPEPGKCPICSMELIPRAAAGPGAVEAVSFGPRARTLMQLETAPVERRFVTAEVRMPGTVDYDETRTATVSAWVGGRLDRLYVDYTGMAVRAGDHMAELYSPELIGAQEELIQAFEAVSRLRPDDPNLVRESAVATARAAREKLRLLGVTAEQIGEIIAAGEPRDRLTLHAPIGGIVIRKHANAGDYVKTGEPIYTLANLSQVWVRLDAYESDLVWLRLGQRVAFAAEAYPGEQFDGRISFISPIVEERTRTVKLRVTAENADGRLKPGLYVRAVVRAEVAAGGKVIDTALADKWLCPMHPGVVKPSPGSCDICGMPLEPAEALGYVGVDRETAPKPLVVPASAVLQTGRRAVAYVERPDRDPGRSAYVPRQVTLGPRAGDYYLVRAGLAEGEQVVTRGNFKIDSERQLRGLTSMMNPPPATQPVEGAPATPLLVELDRQGSAFREGLAKVFDAYLAVASALAGDDANAARAAADRGAEALAGVDASALPDGAGEVWGKAAADLAQLLTSAAGGEDIQAVRAAFQPLSRRVEIVARHFGPPGGRALYVMHCPMAFSNRGASWLQAEEELRNPYFGASMLRCGSVEETIAPPASAP